MQLKDKIKNIWSIIDKYFLTQFCLSASFVLIIISIFKLKIGSVDNSFILYAGLIFGFLSFFLWFKKLNNENKARIFIIKILSPLFLISLFILTISNLNSILKIDLHLIKNIEPILILISIFSGFIIFYANREKVVSNNENENIDKQKNNTHLILLAFIVIISTLARILLITSTSNINFEKGLTIYDFSLINQGLIPFKDFLAREPIPMMVEGFSALFFGINSYEIYLTVFLYIISAPLLFIFLKTLKFDRFQIIFTFIFFYLSTFGLFKSNLLVLIFLLINLIIFFKILEPKPKSYLFLLLGLSLILILHTYRAYIFLFIIEICYLFLINKKILNIKELFLLYIPWILLLYIPSIYFLYIGSFNDLVLSYQVDKIMLVSSLPLLFFVLYKVKSIKKIIENINLEKFIYYSLYVMVILSFFFFNSYMLDIKVGVMTQFYRYSAGLIIISLIASFNIFIKTKYKIPFLLFLLSILSIFYLGIDFHSRGPTLQLDQIWQNILIISLFLICPLLMKLKITETGKNKLIAFCYFYLSIVFIISNYYGEWLEGYFGNYFIILVILSGLFLSSQFKNNKTLFGTLFLIFIIVNSLSISIIYFENKNTNNSVSVSRENLNEIMLYFQGNLDSKDIIFTTTPWYLIQLNHKQSLYLPHPVVYINPSNSNRFGNITTPYDLEKLLSGGRINFIIADQRFRDLFMGPRYPNIKLEIEQNFYLDKNTVEKQVQIYKLKI